MVGGVHGSSVLDPMPGPLPGCCTRTVHMILGNYHDRAQNNIKCMACFVVLAWTYGVVSSTRISELEKKLFTYCSCLQCQFSYMFSAFLLSAPVTH